LDNEQVRILQQKKNERKKRNFVKDRGTRAHRFSKPRRIL